MKLLAIFLLAAAAPLYSHVGSPDVYYEGAAGPYRLLVTIRPPQVVPGVAEIEIRSVTSGIQRIRIAPLRMAMPKQYSPVPDVALPSKSDPRFFTGSVWLMSTGSWKVLIQAEGARGKGEFAVPVPALSTRTLGMQAGVAMVLVPLGLVLLFGLVAIVGASVREAQLEPGDRPARSQVTRARIAMAVALLMVGALVYFGDMWWRAEAGSYSRIIYKPLQLQASVKNNALLTLTLHDPGWLRRRTDDLLPDHGHLMHLFIVNLPRIDRVWHLHPNQSGEPDTFTQTLPAMPAGLYALFADIVHADGLAETATARLDLPQIGGSPLRGDDAGGDPPILPKGGYNPDVAELPGGYRMMWERSGPSIRAGQPYQFRFRLVDPSGADAKDVELYMGMLGHAMFVKDDGSVFAHVHPSGSVPAASLALVSPEDEHMMHQLAAAGLPAQISFPFGLPQPGVYRLFIQMKRGGEIMTGMFNASVEK